MIFHFHSPWLFQAASHIWSSICSCIYCSCNSRVKKKDELRTTTTSGSGVQPLSSTTCSFDSNSVTILHNFSFEQSSCLLLSSLDQGSWKTITLWNSSFDCSNLVSDCRYMSIPFVYTSRAFLVIQCNCVVLPRSIYPLINWEDRCHSTICNSLFILLHHFMSFFVTGSMKFCSDKLICFMH